MAVHLVGETGSLNLLFIIPGVFLRLEILGR